MFLLDTNACIRILNNSSAALIKRLGSENPAVIRLCSIVKAELLYGARHSSKIAANLKLLERFIIPFISLPFDDRCSEEYAILRAALTSHGRLIGPNDLLID